MVSGSTSFQRVRHWARTGGLASHARASFMPRTSGPQAVFCALRAASARVSAEAVAQFSPPLKLTHTSQTSFWARRVETNNSPPKPMVSPIPMIVDRFMSLTVRWTSDGA